MPIPRLVDGGGGEVKGSAHWPRHRGDVRSRVPVAQTIAMNHNGLSETFFRRKESSISQASSTRISLNRVTLVAGFAANRVPWLDRFLTRTIIGVRKKILYLIPVRRANREKPKASQDGMARSKPVPKPKNTK